MRGGRAAEFVAVLILALGTWLGFATSGLPGLHDAQSPAAGAFSTPLAMQELQKITVAPHPVGTAEHDRVRDYLVDRLRALGLADVHVQSATGFNTLQGPLAATVGNVVGRKRGTRPGPAILLAAHYDAVPRSFGAGDDGAGVAAILETLRALVTGPPIQRDVMVVFYDAEESGLLGAEAFVNLHPWAKDVGIVLNFDGRGTDGPVYMFQTSGGNALLIDALAQVPGARTNSLTGEVYRHLPSDTDLSIWLHSRYPVAALNFAHVGGYPRYHTPMDNIGSLDERVVAQMGSYALSLTRTLGADTNATLRTTDAIYFDAPLIGVVHYPASWAVIVAIDALALVLLLVGIGLYRRTITMALLGRGALALLITLAVPTLVTLVAWRLILFVHPGYREILQGDPYNSLWYLLSAGAFTVAIAVEVQRRFAMRESTHDVAMALALPPMLLWGVLGLLIAVELPGGSYLLVWPLFAATMCASWWRRETLRGRIPPAWLAVFALPLVVLWPPLVKSLEVALTADMLPFCALLLALMLALLVLPLQLVGQLRRGIVIGAMVVSVAALVRAELTSRFNASRKRPDSLSYLVDADSATGRWVSFDLATDSWTSRALGAHPARAPFSVFGLTRGAATLLSSPQQPAFAPPSPIQILDNQPAAGGRRIHLHVARIGVGQTLALYLDNAAGVTHLVLNGRILEDGEGDRYSPRYRPGPNGLMLRYFGVPEEGVDLWFTVATSTSASLRVVVGVEGLPDLGSASFSGRPVDLTSKPFVPTDMTITTWRVQL